MKTVKRLILGAGVLAVAAVASAFVARVTALEQFGNVLHSAEGLSARYTVTTVGGTTAEFSVDLAKPNRARIEGPTRLVVADGQNITIFEKDRNRFYVQPQTEALLLSELSGLETQIWAPFFDKDAFSKMSRVRAEGTRNRRGMTLDVVRAEVDPKAETVITFFIDQDERLARQAEMNVTSLGRTQTLIMNASKVELAAPSADLFTFTAPEGAREVSLADLVAGKWHSFAEGMELAREGNKLVMVGFVAEWCGPCKMMEAQVYSTDAFKLATQNMVLIRVDVDREPALAQQFGVTAMPTVKFLNPRGEVVHEFIGYGGPAQVMSEIEAAKGRFGR